MSPYPSELPVHTLLVPTYRQGDAVGAGSVVSYRIWTCLRALGSFKVMYIVVDPRTWMKQKTGRAMQEKDVKFTDKKGKQRVRQGCSPIREGVVNIKPDTTMEDLLRYVERVHERWGIRALQIHIHKDEGHYEMMEQRTQCQASLNIAESRQNSADPATEDPASWEPNYHAHIIWDWMDHDTGKSFKLNAEDMSAIQDLVAETLDMQRGQKKSETGIDHLERNDFIIQKQENKKKKLLQEEAKKAIAEKEESNNGKPRLKRCR